VWLVSVMSLHAVLPHKFGYCAPMEDLSLDIRNYITSRIGNLDET